MRRSRSRKKRTSPDRRHPPGHELQRNCLTAPFGAPCQPESGRGSAACSAAMGSPQRGSGAATFDTGSVNVRSAPSACSFLAHEPIGACGERHVAPRRKIGGRRQRHEMQRLVFIAVIDKRAGRKQMRRGPSMGPASTPRGTSIRGWSVNLNRRDFPVVCHPLSIASEARPSTARRGRPLSWPQRARLRHAGCARAPPRLSRRVRTPTPRTTRGARNSFFRAEHKHHRP